MYIIIIEFNISLYNCILYKLIINIIIRRLFTKRLYWAGKSCLEQYNFLIGFINTVIGTIIYIMIILLADKMIQYLKAFTAIVLPHVTL